MKRHIKYERRLRLSLITTILILVATALPAQQFTTPVVGTTHEIGNLEFTVNKLIIDKDGHRFATPDSGKMFLVLDLTIKNVGAEEETISSIMDFELLDMNGRQQDGASLAYDTEGDLNGDLAPERRMTGQIVFEIPTNVAEYELQISAGGMFSSTKGYVPITIPARLLSGSAPASGSDDSDAFATVELGDLVYRVNEIIIDTEGQGRTTPDSGKMFLVIDIGIENVGDDEESISSVMGFELFDMNGRSQSSASMSYSTAGSLNGDLLPGRRMSGQLAFEVPSHIGEYELAITYGGIMSPETEYVPIDVPDEYVVKSNAPRSGAAQESQGEVEVGALVFMLNDVIVDEDGEQFASPDEGNVYLVLDMTIRNQGDETESFSTRMGLALYDSDGRKQDSASIMYSTEGDLGGDVAPGRRRTGQVAFEVAEDKRDFELEISVGSMFDPTTGYLPISVSD